MQVDVPPWVSQWLSAAEWRRRQRERDRRMPGLTLYAYGPYGRDPPNPVQPIFRLGGFPEQRDGVLGPRFGEGTGAGEPGVNTAGGWVPLHYPLDPFLAHNPNDLSHLPINLHGTRQQRVNVEWLPPARATPRGRVDEEGLLSGRAALRAWVFGSALVVLVLVLVRAIDKCLTVNLLKSRRRRSQEWPTPNVRATSRHETDISTVMIPDSEGDEPRPADYSDVLSVDLPPPYSECTAIDGEGGGANITPGTSGHKLPAYEDPPPAYSDTYVEFSNKNGVPSVLIYSRRRTPLVNRRDIDASESDAIDDEPTSSEQNAQNNDTEINRARDVQRNITNETRYRENNTHNASDIEPSNDNNASLRHMAVNIENSTTDTNGGFVANPNLTTGNIDDEGNTKEHEIMV